MRFAPVSAGQILYLPLYQPCTGDRGRTGPDRTSTGERPGVGVVRSGGSGRSIGARQTAEGAFMASTVRRSEPAGITLNDLEDFVRDAIRAGVRGNEVITAEVHGEELTKIEVEIR